MSTNQFLDLDLDSAESTFIDSRQLVSGSMDATLTRHALAGMIDHTNLRPDATPDAIEALCRHANEFGVKSICVSPNMLPLPSMALREDICVGTVCGFPSGAHTREVKAAEATLAVEAGASEIDVVVDLGLVKAGRWSDVEADIALLRRAVPFVTLKVIIESAALTNDQIMKSCKVVVDAGADFVKTSTGFHPAGGATLPAVSLMARTVGGQVGVKASGGIRTLQDAKAMIECGATRLGTSSTADILASLD